MQRYEKKFLLKERINLNSLKTLKSLLFDLERTLALNAGLYTTSDYKRQKMHIHAVNNIIDMMQTIGV